MMNAQLSLFEGRRRRDNGIRRVSEHNRWFLEKMRKAAIKLSLLNGEVTIDDLRTYAFSFGLEPDHPNAWGGVLKGKHWHCVGFQPSKLVSNHGRVIRRWIWKR